MSEEIKELEPLSKKHQRVLDQYLILFNQTKAYQLVYPKATYESARTSAAALFAIPNFSAHLQARLAEVHMSAEEAIKLLSDMARGDIAQIMDVSGMGFSLNMQRAQELGLTKLIKKVKQKTTTHLPKNESDEDREVNELEVELYDAQAAIDKILKIHGKYVDKMELTGKDGAPLQPETMKPSEIAERVAALLKKKDDINSG